MEHATSRIRASEDGDVVHLPEGYSFGVGREVELRREGDRVVISPVPTIEAEDTRLREFHAMLEKLEALGRPTSGREVRDADWWPDRANL